MPDGARGRCRVLFIDHETRLSGGQQDLVDLIGALDPARIEPHVALPGDGPLAEALGARGATIHVLAMSAAVRGASRWELMRRPHLVLGRLIGSARASVALWRIIGEVRPALVHTNSMKAHLLAALPAGARRVPLVMHVRDILPPGWLSSVLALAGAVFARRIVCLSSAVAAQFDGTRAARRAVVVHNGIELARFNDGSHMREGWGARDGEVLVGMVGQIAHWKGQDVFVEAAARFAERDGVRFVVVGECLFPANESAFDAGVRERARAAGFNGRFTWAGWVDDVPSAMRSLDVLVHASRLPEPFGRVLVEGMAAGAAVITTTIGAGPEIVPAAAGRLVPPDDADALADALAELIEDDEERRRCGGAAREAAARFDIARTARAIEALYGEVLGRPCG